MRLPWRSRLRRRRGTWHVRTYTDPKRPSVGETTFLVEDYVPDRIEFDVTSPTGHISQKVPAKIDVAGRFLYGAPAANLDLEGEVTIAAAKERAGFAGYHFGLDDEEVDAVQQPLEDLPTTDAAGKASFDRSASTSCRRAPVRWRRRSRCAWPSPAAAPSSTRSPCRSRRTAT